MEDCRESLVLRALEALKKACKDLQRLGGGGESAPDSAAKGGDESYSEEEEEDEQDSGDDYDDDDPCNSPSMKALLVLQRESDGLFSRDPHLSTLSHLLSHLKTLACRAKDDHKDDPSGGGGLLGAIRGVLSSLLELHNVLLHRRRRRRWRSRPNSREISRVAGSIESEIQSWIDRESLDRLVSALPSIPGSSSPPDEERLAGLLLAFEDRLSRGFDRELQDAVLRSGAFPAVASVLADQSAPPRVRDRCAAAVAAMVRFNRDVFVGAVLMGGGSGGDADSSSVLQSLVSMGTPTSVRVLRTLVGSIKSALVDELHADGLIPRVVGFLSSPEAEVRRSALDLVLEIGYYGRKEAVEAMLEAGAIKRLLVLQRSELGGALIEMDDDSPMAARPFASCVARLAIQVEVGEGLRRREKAAVKREILARVREAVISDAEAATVLAEVLWGATP